MQEVSKAITALLVPVVLKLVGELGVNDLDVTTVQTAVAAVVAAVLVFLIPNRPSPV